MTTKINGTNTAASPAITGADTDTGLSFGTDTVNINTGGSTRATVDSSGRLLLGTTTAGAAQCDTFTLETSGHTGMTLFSGSSSRGTIAFGDGRTGNEQYRGAFIYDHSDDSLRFVTADGERVRIDQNGRLLVGTTTNSIGSSGATVVTNFAGNADNGIKTRDSASNSSANHMVMISGSTDIGQIVGTTSSVSYNSLSDYRLKENVVAISDGISRLKTLKPSRFNFIIDPDKTVDGFLAHEVTAVPEAVSGTKDAVDSNGKPIHQSMDSAKLVPLLTAALQEAIAKIETLETKVAALEAA